MRINESATNFAAAILLGFSLAGFISLQAAEKSQSIVSPNDIRVFDKKGGRNSPAPPADPHCPRGSAGPITHEQVTQSCKVNGEDGSKVCYIKSQKCLSGPGEAEYAQTENCGRCMALPQSTPEQTQTHTQN